MTAHLVLAEALRVFKGYTNTKYDLFILFVSDLRMPNERTLGEINSRNWVGVQPTKVRLPR